MKKYLKEIWFVPFIAVFSGLLNGFEIEFKNKVIYIIIFSFLLYLISRIFKKLTERKK